MLIKMSAVSVSPAQTPVLMGTKESLDEGEAVLWANTCAWVWIRAQKMIANKFGGHFNLDGVDSQPQDNGDEVPCTFFNTITDEFIISANMGEEIFVVGVTTAD